MSVLGIELRPTFVAATLREGSHRPRMLDDGQRMLIPLTSLGAQWGSHFASQPHSPWNVATPASSVGNFPTHLFDRLGRFLGGEPPAHSLQAVLATSVPELAAQFESAEPRFVVRSVISPPEAAVAAWLSRQMQTPPAVLRVASITIGDLSAEAGLFQVQTGPRPAILERIAAAECPGTGVGYWTQQIIREVQAHLAEGAEQATRVDLWQAALEFGDLLHHSQGHAEIVWNGPLEGQMLSPLILSKEMFLSWPEVTRLTNWLQFAVRKMLRDHHVAEILLAGVGASWPLEPSVFVDLPLPYRPTDGATEIAVGASFWPHLRAVSREEDAETITHLPPPQIRTLGLQSEGQPRIEYLARDFPAEEKPISNPRSAEQSHWLSEQLKDIPEDYA